MKLRIALVLVTSLLAVAVVAQEKPDPEQALYNLRVQLIDVQSREAQTKLRLEQLDSDLKPENIERYFNGFGSTRPEELREARRKQLQDERARVVTLLDQLSSERVRLESAVVQAQTRAYQESALGAATTTPNSLFSAARVLTVAVVALVFLGALAFLLVRKRSRSTANLRH